MSSTRHHRVARTLALLGVLLLLLTLCAGPLYGQRVGGTVLGSVYDSLRNAPLEGARAALVGTAYESDTDEQGRFRIGPVPPGRYTLSLEHPVAGLYRLGPAERSITITDGGTVIVDVAFPSLETVLSRLCPDRDAGRDFAHPEEPSIVLGFVREAGSGRPVPEARVWIGYSDVWGRAEEVQVRMYEAWNQIALDSDSTGAYLACGMPGNWDVISQAETAGAASDTIWRRTPPGDVLRLDFEVSPEGEGPGVFGLDRRAAVGDVWDPRAEEERSATLLGTVKSAETGEPVGSAHVRLLRTDVESVTREDGTFVMEDLPVGRYRVVTAHLGMVSDTAVVDLRGGAVSVATLTMQTRPIELPSLDVEIERTYRNPRIAGFYERMRRGIGEFITAEDLELTDVIGAFRRLPNVRVEQCVLGVTLRKADCWDIEIARGVFADVFRKGAKCRPLIYIDGHQIQAQLRTPLEEPAFTRLQSLPRDMIEGIEVYRNPAGAPGQYRMLGDACGIVLVWTRTGR